MVKYAVLILILIDVILNVTGQLSLKYGMSKIGNFSLSLSTLPPVFLKAATDSPCALRTPLLSPGVHGLAHRLVQGGSQLLIP